MSYYERHIFFCLNERDPGENSCLPRGAQAAFDHCKKRVKAAGMAGPGGVRVNRAGCLNRCAGGPVAVVYPEAVWYHVPTAEDAEEILREHVIGGKVVERLLMDHII